MYIAVPWSHTLAAVILQRESITRKCSNNFKRLTSITVNACIYILNEYNAVRKRFPELLPARAFVKAWNAKVVPIFLTVVSTILGFVPFMVGTGKEAFWFPLAAGTIGGLAMSVVGVFVFLPIFALRTAQNHP